MTVWVNEKTGTVHRDPGCSRLVISGKTKTVEVERPPARAKRCFYCHSRAGYRRYP